MWVAHNLHPERVSLQNCEHKSIVYYESTSPQACASSVDHSMAKGVPNKFKGESASHALGIEIGDIVLIKNDSTSRVFWKMGKVEELIPGKDGKVRAAVVKVGRSTKRPALLRRP